MTCEKDAFGPTCKVPLFPPDGSKWTCPDCGLKWVAGTFWKEEEE